MTQFQFDQIKSGDEVFYINTDTAKYTNKFTLGVKSLFITKRNIVNTASHNLKSGDVYWNVKVKEGMKPFAIVNFHNANKEVWFINKEEAKAEKIKLILIAINSSVVFSSRTKDKYRTAIMVRPNVSRLIEKFPERFV